MDYRHFPVRPNLDQLRHQAKDLLRAIRNGDPNAIAELEQFHPEKIDPASAQLAGAQLILARSYGAPSWPRMVLSCRLIDAIWRDDTEAVRQLVVKYPHLLHENAGIRGGNWGPPMSYAANLGRDAIIMMLRELGATDLAHAIDRATLQGRIGTARMLHEMLGRPRPTAEALGGPAYTLSVSGTALMLELGAPVLDENGKLLAPVAVVIESDSRRPPAKHDILEMYVKAGVELPDTPVMALHRGRIDLLEEHLRRDPNLLSRTFTHAEIYPPEMGGSHEVECQGTPLAGATLLHLCVDYDELDIARWLLDRGMDVDVKAAVDADGFGGHTALFSAVVCYANFWGNYHGDATDSPFARLLLERGADPNARASVRKVDHNSRIVYEYRDVTPIAYGQQYYYRMLVSEPAVREIAQRGGHA
jgi:Ankyrin repeat